MHVLLTLVDCKYKMASLRLPLLAIAILFINYWLILQLYYMLILSKIYATWVWSGAGILIKRHLLLIGLIILAKDSQIKIILHLSIYFSIVLLKDA